MNGLARHVTFAQIDRPPCIVSSLTKSLEERKGSLLCVMFHARTARALATVHY